jgi:hypothetical protein
MPLNGLSKELVGVTGSTFLTDEELRQRTLENAVVARGRERSSVREEAKCAIVTVVVAWLPLKWSEVEKQLSFEVRQNVKVYLWDACDWREQHLEN